MARRFTAASSEKITLGLGQCNFAFGPGTVAAIIKPATISAQVVFSAGSAAAACFQLSLTAGGVVQLTTNLASASGGTALGAGTWYLIAATKATGTATPVIHIRNFSANTWSHVNAGGTLANSTGGTTRCALGVDATGALNFLDGEMTVAACWNVVLTTAQIESLAFDIAQTNWSGYSNPKGFWVLLPNPSFSVYDLTGGGANESARTGTSAAVSEFPHLNPMARMPTQRNVA